MSTSQENQNTELESIDVDHSPVSLSSAVAVGAAIVSALTSATFAVLALPFGLGGAGMIAAGLYVTEDRKWVSLGTASLFMGLLVAGSFGAPVELLLVSTVALVLAWDIGQNAINLGEQIGSHSETTRNELVHASASMIVGGAAAALGYGVYILAGDGQPLSGLSMVLLALLCLMWATRT